MPTLDLGAKPTAEFAILWVGVAVPWEGRCQAQRGVSLVAGSKGHPAAQSQGRGQGPGDCESAPALEVSLYPKGHDIKEHMKTLHQVKRVEREKGIMEPRKKFYILESSTVYVPCFLNKRPHILLWKSIPHIL